MVTMSFDELSKMGLRSVSWTLTGIHEGLQVQFGVPSGNFVFRRFNAFRTPTYVTSDNFDLTLSSITGGK